MKYSCEVMEDIIFDTLDICVNDIVLTEQLIEVIAKSLDITESEIIEILESGKSLFTANNPIQGFIFEKGKYKPYRRLTIYAAVKRMLEKNISHYTNVERVQILQEIASTNRVAPLVFK